MVTEMMLPQLLQMFAGFTSILFGILTTVSTADVVLTLHNEKMTWSDARAVCLQDGGTLISDYRQENIADLMENVSTPVWEGSYYSPWAWILGCYSLQEFIDHIEIKENQMKECVNHCNNTNYFGLQNKKCFCFDNFEGLPLRTIDFCTYKCPGNEDERCGGNNAISIYMNDIYYKISAKWQGTVSRTWSGKQCLPWANITEVNRATVKHFPDGNADNASNFCRDPSNKSYLWCYISQEKKQRCDIPPYIEAANDGVFSCMSFSKPRYKKFQFMQSSCRFEKYAFCAWDNNVYWGISAGTCQFAHQNTIYDKQCKSLAGPRIFWLDQNSNVQDSHWFGYYREVCKESKTVPDRRPQKCFSLSKENVIPGAEDCDKRNAFICQYAPITCGESFNSPMNGSFETPGYNETRSYGAFERCVWSINVAENYFISLSLHVSIEDTNMCRSDFLRVSEECYGTGESFCGDTLKSINTTGNNVTVEFRSDGTMNKFRGAQVVWTAVPVPTLPTTTKTSTTQMSFTTEAVTSRMTQSSDTSTIEELSGDAASDNFSISGGMLVGIIVGPVVVGLVLGIILFLLIRRKTSKNKGTKHNTALDLKNSKTNSTARLPDRGAIDADNRASSEIYQNTANASENATGYAQYAYSDTYLKKNPKDELDPMSVNTSDLYNTLNEATENHYQNKTENVYNTFDDSQEVYDHNVTTQSKTSAIFASEMQTYDHTVTTQSDTRAMIASEMQTYDHTVTTQSDTRAMIASEMQTYDHLTDDTYTYAYTSTLPRKQTTTDL